MLNSINRQVLYRRRRRRQKTYFIEVYTFLLIHSYNQWKKNDFVLDDKFIVQFGLEKSHKCMFDLCSRLLKQAFYLILKIFVCRCKCLFSNICVLCVMKYFRNLMTRYWNRIQRVLVAMSASRLILIILNETELVQ